VSGGDSFDSLLDCKVVSTLFLERHGYKSMELIGKSIIFMFPGTGTPVSIFEWFKVKLGVFNLRYFLLEWGTFFCKRATWLAGSGPGYTV
jgi:hypothetical protein